MYIESKSILKLVKGLLISVLISKKSLEELEKMISFLTSVYIERKIDGTC